MPKRRVTNNGSAKRQSEFRERMKEAGLTQVTGWVFLSQAPDVYEMMQRLRNDPNLVPGPTRHAETGKLMRR